MCIEVPFAVFDRSRKRGCMGKFVVQCIKHVSVGKSLKIISEYLMTGIIREIFPKDYDQMKT